jgi:hypothetical protein
VCCREDESEESGQGEEGRAFEARLIEGRARRAGVVVSEAQVNAALARERAAFGSAARWRELRRTTSDSSTSG